MTPHTMDDVLKDETLFSEKFCTDVTRRNLGEVPLEALQKSIQMIHACSGFRAAATPEWNRDEQPMIVFGRPTIAGSMNEPKFGLTTHVKGSDGTKGTKLFFWLTETAQRKIQQSNKHLDLRFFSSWMPWREGGRQTYRAMPVPLYEQGSLLDASFILPGSNEDVTLSGLLNLLGSKLNLRLEVRAEFANITEELNLMSDCITPRAAEIMKNRKR
ncbi:hypothetical protein [Roseicyclus marinus]|uniref:hypothetical protein n=1 Tax=Roseicyclus marinus TaxID=2161673 RepID=UPI00240FD874|nr:hypothetical protein [Roseicyclus marinus]MDG3039824.1 hypothetical protein [Roseicyclus marinus]